jgi:thioredoxin-like negative regulator of GroEL
MHIFGGGTSKPGGGGSGGGAGGKAGALPNVTEKDFEQQVLLSEIPVLVEFMIPADRTCQAVAPEVEAFAKDVEGKVKVLACDLEKSPGLARQLRIQAVPVFMLFVEQRLGDAQAGPLTKKQLRAMVEPFLPRQAGALKARELAELLKQGAVAAVDVRDAAAFGRAHIPGATNIPLEEIEGRLAELYMLPGQPVIYDRSGDKTKDLAPKLEEQGTPVAFLEGGFLAWEAEGLKIERG